MKNIQELTDELATVFEMVKNDAAFVPQATSLANIAGKILNAQKVRLTYAEMRKEKPEIGFLDVK